MAVRDRKLHYGMNRSIVSICVRESLSNWLFSSLPFKKNPRSQTLVPDWKLTIRCMVFTKSGPSWSLPSVLLVHILKHALWLRLQVTNMVGCHQGRHRLRETPKAGTDTAASSVGHS